MRIAMESSEHVVGILEYSPQAENSHFMPGISDHGAFFWESLKRMSRYEPGGLDVVLGKELQHSSHSNSTREQA